MNILVNAIPLTGLLTGISRCTRCLYQQMELLTEARIHYFNGKEAQPDMPEAAEPDQWIKRSSLSRKLPDALTFILRSLHWKRYEYFLNRELKRNNYDLYHETAFFPAKTLNIPAVFTIYDLSLFTRRDMHPRERVWFHNFFFPRRIRYARHILTISRFIKHEINHTLGIPDDKITAVPLAPATHFEPKPEDECREILSRLNIPDDFFLFVGSLEPRKNLDLIIQAMARQENPLPLVLAGWDGWGDKKWLEMIDEKGLVNKIIRPGYVHDQTLACLYSSATGFIYPSLYEGFGLPVIEAMACGCPVICSRAASLPEVAGDAALLVDPHDPAGLALAMDKIRSDAGLRREMIKKGFSRAREFSWSRAAKATLALFQQTASREAGK